MLTFTYTQFRVFVFLLTFIMVKGIYENSPRYFNSFYCNLGTGTPSQNGTYTCMSPKIIEQADSFGLALVEYNKDPSTYIWFEAQVVSIPGMNLPGVEIDLRFKTSYTAIYGYMVLVIGRQPQNTWIDLVNVKLPIDSSSNRVLLQNQGGMSHVDHAIDFPLWLGTPDQIYPFITSYGTRNPNSPNQVSLNLDMRLPNNQILIPSGGSNTLSCGTQTYVYDHGGKGGGYSDSVDGSTTLQNQGCAVIQLIGTLNTETCCDYVQVYAGAGTGGTSLWRGSGSVTFGPINSAPGQAVTIRFYTDSSVTYSGFQIKAFYFGSCSSPTPVPCLASDPNCPSMRTEVLGGQILRTMHYGILMWKNGSVPTSDKIFFTPNLQIILSSTSNVKLDLYPSRQVFGPPFNTKCFFMLKLAQYVDDTVFQLFNSTNNNYYQAQLNSTKAARSIFHFFCIANTASAVLGEFDYIDNYTNNFYSTALDCPVATTNFVYAQNYCNKCSQTQCIECTLAGRAKCILCQSTYGIDSVGSCTLCTTLYANCITCVNNLPSGCTECDSGFGIDSTGACQTCSTIYTNCLTCNSDLTKGCTSCGTGFGITSTATCDSCSVLITNCVSCTAYNAVCTQCDVNFGVNNVGTCSACSSLYPNCLTCTSYHTGCLSCVSGFYELNTEKAGVYCVACSWIDHCLTCTNGPVCLSCDTGYALNFVNLNKTCAPCNQLYKCLQCTDGPVCTLCQPGFFINSTMTECLPCHFPCKECSILPTNCTNCPPSQLFYLTSNMCKLCVNTLTDCVKCEMAGTLCYQCNSTKTYLDANQCVACQPPCLDCLSLNQCLSCATFNFLIVPSTFTCEPCSTFMPRCDTCIKENVCTACTTTGGTYFLTFPPDSCLTCQESRPKCLTCIQSTTIGPECTLCEDKFYVENGNCFNCPVSCALCTSLSVCSSCVNDFYSLQNQLCVLCSTLIPNCQRCSSATTCVKCINGTIVDPAGSGTCVLCTSVQYSDEANQICITCPSPCQTCENAVDCVTCLPFYEHVEATQRCTDFCGDSIVITDQCDNGLGVLNDGCNDQCQQEPSFTCVKSPDTVSGYSVFRSVCSYDLPPQISLFSVQKEPFANTLTFTYLISPYLFGLPGTTSRVFTQDEMIKTFILYENSARRLLAPSPTPGITVQSVNVDSETSKVSVTFTHDRDIKQSQMELYIDFGYLKSTLALNNFATTPDSNHVFQVKSYQPNSMIGEFYTDDQYSHAKTFHNISTMIGILSFLAFMIGLFSKEVVGLEMAMICQFTYLSLFFFRDPLELPFFALKGLLYSTGYNIPLSDMNFATLDQNPPQSFVLGFDPRTFSLNFNLMAVLYVVPLIAVIPFVFLKAKCIRKISTTELGHKWVDLLLGETMLFSVFFNLQYLMFGLIAFYRDGRDIESYSSSTLIWLSMTCTVLSFVGLVFKPEIYGNFRMVFRYNDDLLPEVIAERDKLKECEEHLLKNFDRKSSLQAIKDFWFKVRISLNENFLWRKHRRLHSNITFNHYAILFVFFSLTTILTCLVRNSEIAVLCLSVILLIEVIVVRPYFEVSEKLRAIFFGLVYSFVTFFRYFGNHFGSGDYDQSCLISSMILGLLFVCLVWTFYTLARSFYMKITDQSNDRIGVIEKVFKENDAVDKRAAADEERATIQKLMKRYERVELQYNVNNARADLLQSFANGTLDGMIPSESQNSRKISNDHGSTILGPQIILGDSVSPQSFRKLLPQNPGESSLDKPVKHNLDGQIDEVLKKAEEEKNFKGLKDELIKIHRKKLRQGKSKKISGDKMLKFLHLDNFKKYENGYLGDESPKYCELNIEKKNEVKMMEQKDDSQGSLDPKEDYESVEPKTLDEAEAKIEEEKIMIEENQFVRYERAKEIMTRGGLTINKKLIEKNYENI